MSRGCRNRAGRASFFTITGSRSGSRTPKTFLCPAVQDGLASTESAARSTPVAPPSIMVATAAISRAPPAYFSSSARRSRAASSVSLTSSSIMPSSFIDKSRCTLSASASRRLTIRRPDRVGLISSTGMMPLLQDDVLPYPLGREIECFSPPCDCPQIRDLVLLPLKVGKHRQNRERVPPGEGLQVVEPDAGDCHLDLVNGPPAPVPSLPDQFCGVNTREVRILAEFAHRLGENRDDVGIEEDTDELPFRLNAVEPLEEGDGGDTAAGGDHCPVDGRDIACLFRAVEPEEVSHVGDVDLEPEVGVQLLAPAAPDCGKTEQAGIVLPVKVVLDPGKCARLTADPIVIRKNRIEPPAWSASMASPQFVKLRRRSRSGLSSSPAGTRRSRIRRRGGMS